MSAFAGKADMKFFGNPLSRSVLGVKRTWACALQMSAFDPKRTWTGALHMSAYELLRQRLFPIYEAVMDLRAIFPVGGHGAVLQFVRLAHEGTTFLVQPCLATTRFADRTIYDEEVGE
jgi:hypothetical protein